MIDIFGQRKKDSAEFPNNLPLAYVKFKINYNQEGHPEDLTFLEVNNLLTEIAGKTQNELINKRLTEVNPEFKSFLTKHLFSRQSIYSEGAIYETEIYIEPKNKWFDLHVYIISNNIAVVLLSDCTRRKLLEESLKRSELEYKSLVEDAPIGIYKVNPEGRLITANSSLIRILGVSGVDELAANNPLPFNKYGQKYEQNKFFKWSKLEGTLGNEFKLELKNKTTIYIRESSKAILNEAGKSKYIEGTIEDITEKKVAELQIAELSHFYLAMGIDPKSNIRAVVKKACEIIKGSFSFYSYLSDNGQELITWPDDDTSHDLYSKSKPDGHFYYETTIKGENTPVVIEDLYNTVFFNIDPNVKKYGMRSYLGMPVIVDEKTIGSLCVIGKIPQKYTETEINIIGTLAKVLSLEHKRVWVENHLKKAINDANTANEAKNQFLANMSHEIRTPLNGIIGFAEMLSNNEPDEKKADILRLIESAGYQLLQIINDIFDYSGIESGRVTLTSSEFDLKDLIQEIVGFFDKQAKAKRLQFIVDTDNLSSEKFLGDGYKLRQILVNLISNAIKFTDEGSIIIIAGSEEKDNYIEVKFVIEDTGIGINNDQLVKIFDEFKQLEYYLTKKIKGTGLGLTITKKIVDLMNGTIEVESEQGKGTRFIVTIPFIASTNSVKKNKEEFMKNSENLKDFEYRKIKILLAEDNEANQFLIRAITKSQNWDITIVENGAEAIEKYKSGEYDIILMDVQMPVMNGYDATKIIRELEQEKGLHTPIIALTAYAMKSDKDICIEAGMDDYISKPFKRQQFLDTITNTINGIK